MKLNKKLFAVICSAMMLATSGMSAFAAEAGSDQNLANSAVEESNYSYWTYSYTSEDGIPVYTLNGITMEELRELNNQEERGRKVMHRHNYEDMRWGSTNMVQTCSTCGGRHNVQQLLYFCDYPGCNSIKESSTTRLDCPYE